MVTRSRQCPAVRSEKSGNSRSSWLIQLGFTSSTTQESDAVKSICVSAKQARVAARWIIFTDIWNNVLELKISAGRGKNFRQWFYKCWDLAAVCFLVPVFLNLSQVVALKRCCRRLFERLWGLSHCKAPALRRWLRVLYPQLILSHCFPGLRLMGRSKGETFVSLVANACTIIISCVITVSNSFRFQRRE